jgi:hypothetical protein
MSIIVIKKEVSSIRNKIYLMERTMKTFTLCFLNRRLLRVIFFKIYITLPFFDDQNCYI